MSIECYSERIFNQYFNETLSQIRYGRIYHLLDKSEKGIIIFDDIKPKTKSTVAFGKLGDVEIKLKKEGSFLIKPLIFMI